MQVVLPTPEKLIENAIAVNADLTGMILQTVEPWHRDAALALLLQAAQGRAPVN
jgi:hypothetical protein